MKITKLILLFIFVVILSACKEKKTQTYGTVTDDKTGETLANVKVTLMLYVDYNNPVPGYAHYEDTGISSFTDTDGNYSMEYERVDGLNYLYPLKEGYIAFDHTNADYPAVSQLGRNEINIQMTKQGTVRIEGTVRAYPYNSNSYILPNVKITLLKRDTANSIQNPYSIGIEKKTDNNGYYYLEFEGDKKNDFFLKADVEGYVMKYYEEKGYRATHNYDPGYIVSGGFSMKKIVQ